MKSRIFTSAAILFSCFNLFAQTGIVSTNGKLEVSGSQIVNKNGNPFSVAGMSMFWSGFQSVGGKFYETEVVDHLVDNWDIQVIRAAMAVEEADGGRGYISDPTGEFAKVKTIIDAAIANDIYVIVDYHTHYAFEYETQAITFFEQIATTYGANDHIIYEIFNEPIAETRAKASNAFEPGEFELTWENAVRPYAINVINAIRAIDPDNLIVVGTPGYSQGVVVASNDPITANDLDLPFGADLNLAYTLHFYAGSEFHPPLRAAATTAMNNGIALFVTEWGTVDANGDGAVDDVETKTWMDFMHDNNLSHANWSIGDKGEGASAIEEDAGIQGLLNDQLTVSGDFVRCFIENWQADSFDSCEAGEVVIVDPIDSENVPNGQGIKIEAESDNENTEYLGNSNEQNNGFIGTGEYDGEGVITGLGAEPVQYMYLGLQSSVPAGSYTLQFVVSSDSNGHSMQIERNSGVLKIGDAINIPNTGGLNNYQIVTISGIPISGDTTNSNSPPNDEREFSISFTGGGSGSFNMESFYMILDSEFDENALSVPGFSPELAKLINVYPNPVVDYITVDTDEAVEYRVFDLNGSELVAKTEYAEAVDVTNLSTGIYFIQLYVNTQTQVYKFIKR